MNYNLLTSDARLTDVEVRQWHGEECHVLQRFGDITASALLSLLPREEKLERVIKEEFASNSSCDITLDYKVDGKEYYIPLANNTSDVSDENYWINLGSELVADSIMLSNSFVDVALIGLLDSKVNLSVAEYYSKHAAKKILRGALIDQLVEDGFRVSLCSHDYDINDKLSFDMVEEQLSCLPAYNLRCLLNNYITLKEECGCEQLVSVFLAVAAKAGMLKFEPFISKGKDGHYSLVLKYNRFVHLFRDMYFQCSYTEDGRGTYSSSGVRLDAIYSLFQKYELQDSKLVKYLYYMNLIHCCREIDAFNDLLEHNSELVNEFMQLSTKHLFREYNVKYIDDIVSDVVTFMGYNIYRGKGPGFLDDPKEIYRVSKNETSDFARVNIYDSHIVGIEVWEQESLNEVLFTLPDVFDEGVNVESLADDWNMDTKEFGKMVTDAIYESYEVRCALVAFALNFSGFVTNFLVTYPTNVRKDSKLRALNQQGIKEFKNLGVLYKSEK